MLCRAQQAGAGLDRGPDRPLPLVRVANIQLLARRPGQLVDLQRPAAAQSAEQILRGRGDVGRSCA